MPDNTKTIDEEQLRDVTGGADGCQICDPPEGEMCLPPGIGGGSGEVGEKEEGLPTLDEEGSTDTSRND